jgi:hypothetical protein
MFRSQRSQLGAFLWWPRSGYAVRAEIPVGGWVAYPRRCPLCRADYGSSGAADLRHATVRSEPGGTPSRWRPASPGRLLTLRCAVCRDEYTWDYFAGQPPDAERAAYNPSAPGRSPSGHPVAGVRGAAGTHIVLSSPMAE